MVISIEVLLLTYVNGYVQNVDQYMIEIYSLQIISNYLLYEI